MIIKKVALGNASEAFIEDRLENRTNIIFSDENNKGKTILIQSIVYSIGYESIWPVGFDAKTYFFYSKIAFGNVDYEFLRHKNSILVNGNDQNYIFNSISEFRYFLARVVTEIPKIPKDGQNKIADLSIFYELFFLGQDKRNTSNIIVRSNYNKADFLNMIFSFQGISTVQFENNSNQDDPKQRKAELIEEIRIERRKIQIIKKNPQIAAYVTNLANAEDFDRIKLRLKDLNQSITDLKKQRNREESRRSKLTFLLAELNSLNRNMGKGKIICGDCQSSNIIFTNDDFNFDVSNKLVRDNIISSINEDINLKNEIVEEFNTLIIQYQDELNRLLETPNPDFRNYVLFESEIRNSSQIDYDITKLKLELAIVESRIKENESGIESNKDLQKALLEKIVKEIDRLYKIIDPTGNMTISNLFTKSNETFSGSEEQEFYFCKIVALSKILNHNYPLIIDSFREGELSTLKEEKMIAVFTNLNKQVILTSTLKREEYSVDKYSNFKEINAIDYSQFKDSKLLQKDYVEDFMEIINVFPVYFS